MILADDSPLRSLPSNSDPRLLSILDGTRYSIDMIDLSYNRLRKTLVDIHTSFESEFSKPGVAGRSHPIPPILYTAAFSDAWSIIDASERLRKLLPHLPKSRKNPAFRDFLSNSTTIEKLRNAIQHLDGQISLLANANMSTWGELDWYFIPGPEAQEGTIDILGSMCMLRDMKHARKHPFEALPIGVLFSGPVDRISLTAHGHRVSLTDMVNRVIRVARSIEDAFRSVDNQQVMTAGDLFLQLLINLGSLTPNKQSVNPSPVGQFSISLEIVDEKAPGK